MPPQPLSSQEIIGRLNAEPGNIGIWSEVPTLNGLPIVSIHGPQSISYSPNSGLVLKAFINSATAEVRVFLAKAMNIPERSSL